MIEFPRPWFVCGGWAIDQFLGRETRQHHDIEIGLLRPDQQYLFEQFEGWSFEKVVKGNSAHFELWKKGEMLSLPVHETCVRKGEFVLEILLNESEGQDWIYRRDSRLKFPLAKAIAYFEEIPFLVPEIVLLYKARGFRDKDEADLMSALPKMSGQARHWLNEAIQICEGMSHPWIRTIGDQQ